MDNYRSFDQIRVSELTVIRHGWFRPDYELTDGQFSYGSLVYNGFFRLSAVMEIANKSWTIKRKGAFSRVLFFDDTQTGERFGEIKPEMWSRKISITLSNGFRAYFSNKKIFSRTFTVFTELDGDLITIEPAIWKFKTPFKVNFDPSIVKKVPDMPFLILSGVYLALMRQQQAAAAAH